MTLHQESALAFCREKVCHNTSSLHYATLFQPMAVKAFWLGCFALNNQLRYACLKQLEAGLTQVKLSWWHDALVNAAAETTPHPVILAISKPVICKIPEHHWSELINKVASGCEPKRYQSMADWHTDVRHEAAPWMTLLQAGLNDLTIEHNHLLTFWTEATRLCQVLRLAKYLDQGFQPLPIDMLSKYGVTAEQLKSRQHSESTWALFTEISNQLIERAQLAWGQTPPVQRLYARPLRALFRMRMAELNLHRAARFKLLTEQKTITPLKKFSISWTSHVLRL